MSAIRFNKGSKEDEKDSSASATVAVEEPKVGKLSLTEDSLWRR